MLMHILGHEALPKRSVLVMALSHLQRRILPLNVFFSPPLTMALADAFADMHSTCGSTAMESESHA